MKDKIMLGRGTIKQKINSNKKQSLKLKVDLGQTPRNRKQIRKNRIGKKDHQPTFQKQRKNPKKD